MGKSKLLWCWVSSMRMQYAGKIMEMHANLGNLTNKYRYERILFFWSSIQSQWVEQTWKKCGHETVGILDVLSLWTLGWNGMLPILDTFLVIWRRERENHHFQERQIMVFVSNYIGNPSSFRNFYISGLAIWDLLWEGFKHEAIQASPNLPVAWMVQ